MRVIDPGHLYELAELDGPHEHDGLELRFVRRVGEMYPGNDGLPCPGTTSQEVIRVLIDRTRYVDAQLHDRANDEVLWHLRSALRWLERRAAERRGVPVVTGDPIESTPTCQDCGHTFCRMDCR